MDIILFRKVINNKVLNQIVFKKVHHIFIDIFKTEKTYKWNEVYQSTKILAGNGYFEQLIQYYKRNNIKKVYSKESQVILIIQSKRLDILKYIIEELDFDYQNKFNIESYVSIYAKYCDLLCIATYFGSFEIIKYLETLVKYNNSKDDNKDVSLWNYNDAMLVSPYSNDLQIVEYINSKIVKPLSSIICPCIETSLRLGRIDMFDYLTNTHTFELPNNGCLYSRACIDSGKLEVLQHYLSTTERRKSVPSEDLIDYAMNDNRFDMAKWLHKNDIGIATEYAMDEACRYGSLEVVKWFHENRTEGCSFNAMDIAALSGHLDIIEWLHYNRSEGCTTNAMDYAANDGHLETLKWLHENRTEGCSTYAMNEAASNGHLEIIKWLHENRTEGCTNRAMDKAAQEGHLEVIQWLHHNRTEGCTTDAMDNAAFYRRLDVFKWLHENRTEGCTIGYSKGAFKYAASNGDLEMLKYMHSNGIKGYADYSSATAAYSGKLDVIKWMHENDVCEFSKAAMDDAAQGGHLEVFKWLNENRSEGCSNLLINGVVENGHVDVLQWLLENHFEKYLDASRIQKLKINPKNIETINILKDKKLIV